MVSGIFSIPLEVDESASSGTHNEGVSGARMLREYIGSDENRLVQVAVDSLFDRRWQYNPLVLYGPTGTGKSFLALGIAERWRQRFPQDSVLVTCGPDFARSYANAVDTDGLSTFRKKCRSANLLVLDDVHQMQDKTAAQDELARAIDALVAQNSSVLVTDSNPPGVDASLQPGLQSRLVGGLPIRLTIPGAPARKLLIHRMADQYQVRFSEAAIDLLAGCSLDEARYQFTVTQLNHAVVQLGHPESKEIVDVERVREFLSDRKILQQPTMRVISALVAKYFSIGGSDLRGPSRRRNVVRARGVAMLLAWRLTGKSLEAVGRYFGDRDHTTVLHACRRTELLQETDPAIAKAMEELFAQLKTS